MFERASGEREREKTISSARVYVSVKERQSEQRFVCGRDRSVIPKLEKRGGGHVVIPGRMPGACALHASGPVFPREFPTTSEFPTELLTHRAPDRSRWRG